MLLPFSSTTFLLFFTLLSVSTSSSKQALILTRLSLSNFNSLFSCRNNRFFSLSAFRASCFFVVTLAAFLADVASKPNKAPFIFDDPISSLDQIYEEKTAQRLIELSETRQVIVFTHRLSLLGLLSDKGNCTHIRREPWGCGEHGNIPIFAKKPLEALKDLRNTRLSQSAKILNDVGYEAYYPLAKSICSDIRILIERVVEIELFADVIQRHRRQVHTTKLKAIAKITTADCEYIENLMTEFSTYEHSQSLEAPIQLPDAIYLIASADALIDWLEKFKTRDVTEVLNNAL